ncbi:conserved hypothetical protein [Photobacterium profundum SS9]|uniref:ATPase RavA LARA domain-containing protein n=1 Tax=Photobacterium profundum (strain SS9) TaxID=298386 RepID=Q6LIX0_PHOPR|nr:conserved hypothetical protein [Photobacterium profundum SS9]
MKSTRSICCYFKIVYGTAQNRAMLFEHWYVNLQQKKPLIEAQQIIDEVNEKVASDLVVTFSRESTLRKEWFKYNFSTAKRYNVNHNPRMIKLVMLQQNPSVSEKEQGNSRWVYVDGDEFDKKIRTGHCDVYGFVNKNTNLCRLQFEIDAQCRLVIKDIANRAVLVGIAGNKGIIPKSPQDAGFRVTSACLIQGKYV